jgi:vacuolar-type H+-ATPase subunit D/Vma8
MEEVMGTSNGNGAREREDRRLEVKLTQAELLERGDKMAAAEVEIETLKEQRKALNVSIQNAAGQRAELAHVIERGTEEQQVTCEWQPDYQKNVKRLVRLDTKALVDTKAMTAADREVPLFDDGDSATPPPRSPKARAPRAKKAAAPTTAAPRPAAKRGGAKLAAVADITA